MPKYIFKTLLFIPLFTFILTSIMGCLVCEEVRFRFEFDTEDKNPGKFEIVYYGVKSNETEKDKIMKDYQHFLNLTAKEEEDWRKRGLVLKEREIKVEGKEKLCLHLKGIFQKKDIFGKEDLIFVEANKEIILIIDERAKNIRTNGKITETGKNVIIFWPSSTHVLEWSINLEEYKTLPDNLTEIYLKDKK